MRSAAFALAALVATAHAAAAPWASWGTKKATSNCMTDANAKKVANNFKTLIDAYTDKFANATLTEDFIDYSDSVGELINGGCTTGGSFTLGDATFATRAAFEAGQGAQPAIPFEILNLYNNCNSVTIRWVSKGTGQEPQQVTGIIIMETEKNPDTKSTQKWLINTVYSEFNSGAWLVNLGVFVPPQCPPPPPPSKMLKRSIFV